jgi:hypothetical protein
MAGDDRLPARGDLRHLDVFLALKPGFAKMTNINEGSPRWSQLAF